jgi:hypothetical protein
MQRAFWRRIFDGRVGGSISLEPVVLQVAPAQGPYIDVRTVRAESYCVRYALSIAIILVHFIGSRYVSASDSFPFIYLLRQEWNGSFFKATTLKALGLRIQLGHRLGHHCTNPHKAWNDAFVVLDITGIHEVGLDFCNREMAQPHFIQLLQFHWFPGSTKNPHTTATFHLLKHFQLLSFESKASAFEFYSALARETENTGMVDIKVFSFQMHMSLNS